MDLENEKDIVQENEADVDASAAIDNEATTAPSADQTAVPATKKSNSMLWLIIVGAVALIVLIVGVCAMGGVFDTGDTEETNAVVSVEDEEQTDSTQTTKKTTTKKTQKTMNTKTPTTKAPIKNADKVEYIGDRSIHYYDDYDKFILFFSLKDADYERIGADCYVDIVITNDDGEVVYDTVENIFVTEDDFGMWNWKTYGEMYMVGIDIPVSDITPGTVSSGTVLYTVTLADNGVYFSEGCSHTISDDLPVAQSELTLPELPVDISYLNWDDEIARTVMITDVTYEIKDNDLYLYFAGEKTFDEDGPLHSHYASVGIKLYDSEGYVVESSTFYSPNVCEGDKFRGEETILWDCIVPGESYTLEIMNVT